MRNFKKMRGVKLPKEQQAFLFYACRTARRQKSAIRSAIKDALAETECYSDAVFDATVGGLTVRQAAEKHHYGESVLYEQRARFYALLAKKLFID